MLLLPRALSSRHCFCQVLKRTVGATPILLTRRPFTNLQPPTTNLDAQMLLKADRSDQRRRMVCSLRMSTTLPLLVPLKKLLLHFRPLNPFSSSQDFALTPYWTFQIFQLCNIFNNLRHRPKESLPLARQLAIQPSRRTFAWRKPLRLRILLHRFEP